MDTSSFTSIILFTFVVIGAYLIFTQQVEGRARIILIVAILVVFIIIFMSLPMFKSYTELNSTPQDASVIHNIPASAFSGSQSTSYSLSTWIYINDWNYNYGREKMILNSNSSYAYTDGKTYYSPQLLLHPFDNNLIINFFTYGTATSTGNPVLNTITIPNISIQKWVNITTCFGDNTVDTYINGKLVNTYVTKGPQYIISKNTNSGYTLTPNGGFSGQISNARYYNTFLTPQTAWDIYNAGYSSNMLGSFLSQYSASFTFSQNGTKNEFKLM